MAETIKVQSGISPKAFELLNRATTRRKRGEFIDSLILRFVNEDGTIQDCAEGVLERIERRLAVIESNSCSEN